MDPTQDDSGQAVLPPKPAIPSGKEVFRSIMSEIEPDLVDATVEKLEAKYKGETKEEKKARMERYGKAFAEYEKRFEQYITKLGEEVDNYKREAFKILEMKNEGQERAKLAELESTISSS